MEDVMQIAKLQAQRLGVKTVVVATNSGASAERALAVFEGDYAIIAAGNPSSAHERGLVHHKGITPETIARLEAVGIKNRTPGPVLCAEALRSQWRLPLLLGGPEREDAIRKPLRGRDRAVQCAGLVL